MNQKNPVEPKIPRKTYIFVYYFLQAFSVPYRYEMLSDLRWGYKRRWTEGKRLPKFYRISVARNWFNYQVTSIVIYGVVMRIRHIASLVWKMVT